MNRTTEIPRDAYDVLVIGAGLGGLVAAITAAEAGADVLLMEKLLSPGGTLPISSGLLFHADPSRDEIIPAHHPQPEPLVSRDFETAAAWLRDRGVSLAPAQTKHGRGYRIEPDQTTGALHPLLRHYERVGGTLVVGMTAHELVTAPDGSVDGVRVRGRNDPIRARRVILATGGFQGNPELVTRYIAPWQRLFWRSNPGTTGDGFRMGLEAGAAASAGLDAFVGHLSPSEGTRVVPIAPDDLRASTLACIADVVILNLDGQRFVDESRQDIGVVRALARDARATGVVVFDTVVRDRYAKQRRPRYGDDRTAYEQWTDMGARVASADTLPALFGQFADLGISVGAAISTIQEYDRAAQAGTDQALPVPRRRNLHRCATPPFYAMLVCPDITYTEGGLRVDTFCRAVDNDGVAIEGLYAVGETAGLMSLASQAGGLATAITTGRRAGAHAAPPTGQR